MNKITVLLASKIFSNGSYLNVISWNPLLCLVCLLLFRFDSNLKRILDLSPYRLLIIDISLYNNNRYTDDSRCKYRNTESTIDSRGRTCCRHRESGTQTAREMRRGGSPVVTRYYLGEDPFGGSIYGREREYDGVTPFRRKHRRGSENLDDERNARSVTFSLLRCLSVHCCDVFTVFIYYFFRNN